eukprot:g6603.t1
MNIKVGDTVVIPEYGGVTLNFDNEEYHVFRDEDIMGVIQERRFGDPLATLGDALATRGSPLAPNGADVLILWTKSEN